MHLLIFDIDGTVSNSNSIDKIAFEKSIEEIFSIKVTEDDWETCTQGSDSEFIENVFTKYFQRIPSSAEIDKLQDLYIRHLKEFSETIEHNFEQVNGIANFIQHVDNSPLFIISFATGCWEVSARYKLEHIGFGDLKCHISCSDHLTKLRTDILRNAISKAFQENSFIKRVTYFGDKSWDYSASKSLDINFIGIDIYNDQKLKDLGVPNVFRDFESLDEILSLLR